MRNCTPKHPFPIGGRGGDFRQAAHRVVQVFGQWADNTGAVQPPVPFRGGNEWHIEDPGNDPRDAKFDPAAEQGSLPKERLWMIQSTVRSLLAFGEEIAPVDAQALAGGFNSNKGWAKIGVRLETHAGEDRFQIDAGQPLEVYAVGVALSLWTAANYIEILPGVENLPAVSREGSVENGLYGLAVFPIEEARGVSRAQYSQWINVAANTTGTIAVPPHAKKVQIRQSGSGNASVAWRLAPVAVGSPILEMEIPVGADRQTEIDNLGNGAILLTDQDANARAFQIVWTIEP